MIIWNRVNQWRKTMRGSERIMDRTRAWAYLWMLLDCFYCTEKKSFFNFKNVVSRLLNELGRLEKMFTLLILASTFVFLSSLNLNCTFLNDHLKPRQVAKRPFLQCGKDLHLIWLEYNLTEPHHDIWNQNEALPPSGILKSGSVSAAFTKHVFWPWSDIVLSALWVVLSCWASKLS